MATHLDHLSTDTPASNVSSKDFDDMDSSGLEVPNLSDILKNSPAAEFLGLKKESLPDEEDVPTPEDSEDETPNASDDADTDSETEQDQESTDDEEESKDDTSTQADLPSEEDIDWEYKIPITVDGKTTHMTLEEVRKGFQTDQHLSQKGRELGEQRKKLEEERTTKLNELVQLGTLLHTELTTAEQKVGAKYHELAEKIAEAQKDGDKYKARELRDEQEEVQREYWQLRNKREEGTKKVVEQIQRKQQEDQAAMLAEFQEKIPSFVPDWSDKTAKSIREFALKEGIGEHLLEVIYDPAVIKFINDYRILKSKTEAGAAKRKVVPTAKAVPSKKSTPQAKKDKAKADSKREKVLSGQATQQDELDFLKSLSTVGKKL
jgi:hypothetical protein